MAEDKNYDYGQFVDSTTSSNSMKVLSDLAQKQLDAMARVAAAQAALTKATEALKDVSERELPEAMEEIGMETFTTSSGLKVTLDTTVRASIPKASRIEAHEWLRARGFAPLIKRKIIAEFGKGEDDKAEALYQELSDKYGLVVDEASVHTSTLSSWAKDQLQKGKDIPFDIFGLHKQRQAKIALPK